MKRQSCLGPRLALALCTLCAACSAEPSRERQQITPGETGTDPSSASPVDAGALPSEPDDAGGTEDDAGVGDAQVAPPPVEARKIVALDTQAAAEVRAGQTLTPTCLTLDDLGEAELLPADQAELRFSPTDAAFGSGGGLFVQRATTLQVWCQAPALGLSDDTPATVVVLPGEPGLLETTVDRHVVQAGEALGVECRAYDLYRNPVDAEPEVHVEPSDGGASVAEGRLSFTRAGIYQVSCQLPGASGAPAAVEVRPGAPVGLVIDRVPDEAAYGVGAVVQIAARATDAYGNEVPGARVILESEPSAERLGASRLRFGAEGTFTVRASLEADPSVQVSTEITINGLGPDIFCGGAEALLRDGAMVVLPDDGKLTFQGRVADPNDVQAVTVNGQPVELGEGGDFSFPLTARFGMNFVDIVATDSFGSESTRICSFLASRRYHPPADLLGGAVTLALAQAALDDGDASGELNSLNDLLHRALNARALRDALHEVLLKENPVKPRSCDQKVFGACVFKTEITYLDSELRGPNSTRLTLIPGGVRARVELRDVRLKLRVDGTLDSTGWAKFDRIAVDADFDAKLIGGVPSIRVRRDSVQVSVEGIRTDFGGVAGFFLDIVLSLAKGKLRDAVKNLVRDWVRDNFNQILDGVLGGLDISSLGSDLRIPSLDGSRDIAVRFGLGFSSLDVTPARMRFGIGTRFTGESVVAHESLGVALVDGPVLRERDGNTPAEVAVQISLFNQVLHALWRAGLFEGNAAGALGDGAAADGLQIYLSAQLPPVAHLRADGVTELGLGALRLSLVYPGLWEEPISLSLGARATMKAALDGDDLRFSDLVVEELLFSADGNALDSESRDVLTGVLMSLVQSLVSGSLNDAIPALPIPSFELPDELTDFGLPAGARIGLQGPSLEAHPPHFVLRSSFGLGDGQ